MSKRLLLTAILTGSVLSSPLWAADKVTFNDHVLPVFKNACLNCHNPDKKKAGLDLSTFQGTLLGSDNGKVVDSGNPGKSLLLNTVKHTEEPKMPPKGDKLTDAEIAMVENWIKGQLLESANSKAVQSSNNVQLTVISLDKPDGPPPMPNIDLPQEPLVRTKASNAVVALAASPWAPLVAVGGQKQIILYNTETLQTLGILPFQEGFPAVIRFSRNGQLLLTGGGLGGKSGKVVLWKVQSGERAGQVGDEFDQVLGADVSPDHAFVALGGPTKILKIYSTKDGKMVDSVKKHTDWITAVAFSPDGKYLASADRNGGVEVWEGATSKPYISLPGHKASVTALAFMPGVLASASEDGKITLWDVKEGKEIRSWNAHAGGVSSVDFTTDGRLVSSGRDKLAKAWDQNGKALLTSQPFPDIALRAVLSNERVIAGDWTGQIRVINLADGKPVGELTANPPLIAESLEAAQKRVVDLTEQIKAGQASVAAIDAKMKAELAALVQKRTADLAQLDAAQKKAEAAVQALKAAPVAAETQVKTEEAALATLNKERDSKPEAERAAYKPKVEAQAAKVKQAQNALAAAKTAFANQGPAAEKALNAARDAFTALNKTPAKLVPTPQSIAMVDQALKQVTAHETELNKMQAERGKVPNGTPAATAADNRLNAKRATLAQARQALDAAKAAAASAPVEQELAKAQAALAALQTQLPLAQADIQRWQRAQAFMVVYRAKENLDELKNKHESLLADAKDALVPAEKIKADIAAADKVAATAAAGAKEKEAAAAKLKAEFEAAKKSIGSAQSAVAAAEARVKAATPAAPAPPNELPTAKAELAKRQQAVKDLEAKSAEAVKVAEAAKKLAESETTKAAELRKTEPKIVAEATAAKTKAEQEAAAAGKALEEAKAKADRVRTEYETRFRAQQAPAPKPLAMR